MRKAKGLKVDGAFHSGFVFGSVLPALRLNRRREIQNLQG
jgi:hypothetical protein